MAEKRKLVTILLILATTFFFHISTTFNPLPSYPKKEKPKQTHIRGYQQSELEAPYVKLQEAIKDGEIGMVKHILYKHSLKINYNGYLGKQTPLHLAAKHGHYRIAKMLLQMGADPHKKTVTLATPLFFAIESKKEKLIVLLLKQKALINLHNDLLETPLHLAVRYGLNRIVKLLLEKRNSLLPDKINIEAFNNRNETPLFEAVRTNNIEATEMLLSHGANIHHKNICDEQPIHMAAGFGNRDMVELLLCYKANINAKGYINRVPLHYAVFAKSLKTVQFLLEKDASSMEAIDKKGLKPSDYISAPKKIESVTLSCKDTQLYTFFVSLGVKKAC